jgi:hypothetical protein
MFWTLIRRRHARNWAARRRTRLIGPIESLEERLLLDASFFPLATGSFMQDWSTIPITSDNDWSDVPSIVGYRGDGLAPTPGTDPQTILVDGTDTPLTVLANQTDPGSLPPGGIAEFSSLSKPTVALSADGTAQAPFLLLNLDTRGTRNVRASFDLRDLVLPASNVPEPYALQYRIGTSGDFTNLETGFVADASNGANPGNLVTPVNVTLPGETYDQPQVQLRIVTTNPSGAARWIAVDDIQVTGTEAPGTRLTFSIDPASSSLALSGSLDGSPILQQGAGSLTTTYSGTIAVVWHREDGTIQFDSAGSDAVAANSGNWRPGAGAFGVAPANYGALANDAFYGTLQAALRELHTALLTNTPLALAGSGPYTFDSSQPLIVTHGFADYYLGGLGLGRVDLSNFSAKNASATDGTLEDLGSGNYRLTLPVDVTLRYTVATPIGGRTAVLHIQGAFVANATPSADLGFPVVDLNGDNPGADNLAGFVAGGPPVAIAPNATVTRTPEADLTSAFVTLLNRPDGTNEQLAANVSGTGLAASYNSVNGQLTISGDAPPSVYQAVLQTLTYHDATFACCLNTANRLIDFTASDGAINSQIRTAVVTIAPRQHPPIQKVPPAQSTAAGTPLTFASTRGNSISLTSDSLNPIVQLMLSVSNGTLTLASTSELVTLAGDNGTATVTVRGTSHNIDVALNGLVYTPDPGFAGTDTLTVKSDNLRPTDATGASHHQTTLSTVSILVQAPHIAASLNGGASDVGLGSGSTEYHAVRLSIQALLDNWNQAPDYMSGVAALHLAKRSAPPAPDEFGPWAHSGLLLRDIQSSLLTYPEFAANG